MPRKGKIHYKIQLSLKTILLATVLNFLCVGFAWSGDPAESASTESKPNASLTETYWKLLTLNGQQVTLGAGGKELQIVLKDTNKVNGFSGCNRFMGSFENDGDHLKFGAMAATMMMCAETMEQEQEFLKALESAASYTLHGEVFTIYNSEKFAILHFESVYLQ